MEWTLSLSRRRSGFETAAKTQTIIASFQLEGPLGKTCTNRRSEAKFESCEGVFPRFLLDTSLWNSLAASRAFRARKWSFLWVAGKSYFSKSLDQFSCASSGKFRSTVYDRRQKMSPTFFGLFSYLRSFRGKQCINFLFSIWGRLRTELLQKKRVGKEELVCLSYLATFCSKFPFRQRKTRR